MARPGPGCLRLRACTHSEETTKKKYKPVTSEQLCNSVSDAEGVFGARIPIFLIFGWGSSTDCLGVFGFFLPFPFPLTNHYAINIIICLWMQFRNLFWKSYQETPFFQPWMSLHAEQKTWRWSQGRKETSRSDSQVIFNIWLSTGSVKLPWFICNLW